MNKKVIFTSNKEVAIVIDNIKTPFLDELMLRFPYIVQDVFQELNDKSLTNFRNVSIACCDFIDNEKFYLVRKIQNCVSMKEFQQQWKKVLKNIPTESTKEIFVAGISIETASTVRTFKSVNFGHGLCSKFAFWVKMPKNDQPGSQDFPHLANFSLIWGCL